MAPPPIPAAAGAATGIGVGLRRPHFDAILTSPRQPAWVEVLPENYARGGRPRVVLDEVRRRMPVVSHGVSLSVGGPDPLHPSYLDDLARFCERWQPSWFTDHLSLSSAFGFEYQDLVPLPFSERLVDHVAARARRARDLIGLPFGLENASYYLRLPGGELGEAAMLRRVLEAADCGLLLDVNNVYVNAMNHGYDPWAFIASLPLERVMQVHLAGHEVLPDGMRFDTHGAPVPDPVWDLYGRLVERIGDVPTLIEWDNAIPPWDVLMDEADRAAAVRDAALARRAASPPAPATPARALLADDVPADVPPLAPAQAARAPHAVLATVAHALDGTLPVDDAARALDLGALEARRLGFYRDLVAGHARRVLDLLYPDTRLAAGPDRFDAWARAYNAAHPMRDYDWNATGAAFPAFLAGLDAPAWAADLARFEAAWYATATHPAELPPPDAPLGLNPTLTLHTFAHAVAAFSAAAPQDRPDAPLAAEEAVLLLRRPERDRVAAHAASPRALLALKIAAEGLTASDLAALGADPALHAEVLREALAAGLLVGAPPAG